MDTQRGHHDRAASLIYYSHQRISRPLIGAIIIATTETMCPPEFERGTY